MKRINALFPVVLTVCSFVVLATVTSCDNKKPTSANATNEPPAIVPSTEPQTNLPGDKPAPGKTINVFVVTEDANGNQSLSKKDIALPVEDTLSPAAYALKTLIDDSKSPLPKGTVLKSVKIAADGVATADFSHEFKDNFPGGDTAEALAINSVLATLGQFKSVKTVQFLVEGKKIDSLGGNQTLDEPLPIPQESSVTGSAEKGETAQGGG